MQVRSLEEGFLGSWHTASLVEGVKISSMIDGVMPAEGEYDNYRGWIRPLPPPLDIGKNSLHYGECVDSFYRDAWWEGVIFDHEDGSENRRIFFPDMDDEMTVCVNTLRITQDWDGVTEEWKPRGNWIFLELVKELEHKYPFLVSVRQV
nr:increased DNA methylation 1 [Ipomoea batatas]